MEKRKLCSIASILAIIGGTAGCGSAPDVDAETVVPVHQRFSTSPLEPNHEDITRAGLSFLRPEILKAIVLANVVTDVEFALVNANHFDDCNFTGGSRVVTANQAQAVRYLDPRLPPAAEAAALLSFGRSLHALQDFYAHTNWVELGGQVLADSSLREFPTLSPYSTVGSTGFVIVQGPKPKRAALKRDERARYPSDAIVTLELNGSRAVGLISGTVDYEPGDLCPRSVAMTHAELNKDQSTTPGRAEQHVLAKALATRQTRHEWCRLAAMSRAAWGEAGTARLASWVADGAVEPDCTSE